MTVLICPECGAENPLEAESCRECGASLVNILPSEKPGEDLPGDEPFDFASQDANDLPDLLQSLKQEDDLSTLDETQEPSEPDGSEESPSKEPQEEDTLPEWLRRIRQRAQEEEDSVGEITQKIAAAKDTLADDKQGQQHENFSAWLESVQKEEKQKSIEDTTEVEIDGEGDREPQPGDEDWLKRIRKIKGDTFEEEETLSPEDQAGDSLLQWLVALETGQATAQEIPDLDSDETAPEGDTQAQKAEGEEIGIGDGDTLPVSVIEPVLDVSREEQELADKLRSTIADEKTARPERTREEPAAHWVVRLILAVLLIGSLSLSLFFGNQVRMPQGTVPPQNEAVLDWAEDSEDKTAVLLIFDYAAGYANEVERVALPVLQQAIQPGTTIGMAYSNPSGLLLSERLIDQIDDYLKLIDFGYYPTSALGAYGLTDQTAAAWEFIDYPESKKPLPEWPFSAVVILSNSYEGAAGWVEQMSALDPDRPIYLLVTAQAGPLLQPYYQSGQVAGMVSGMTEAAVVETLLDGEGQALVRWRSYQIGVLICLIVIVIGVILNGSELSTNERRVRS